MTARMRIRTMVKQSFKENYKPGFLLQAVALTIVLLYYLWPAFQQRLQALGQFKTDNGIWFAAVSTALFGGVLPFLLMWTTERNAMRRPVRLLLFYTVFWFLKGIEVDAFYRVQAWLYGDSNHPLVVFKKVFTDQLIYCPVWAVPTMMVFYLWKDSHFNIATVKAKFVEDSFFRRWLRVLAPNLVVWIPAVAIIYQLPLALQLPLFNIVLAFWTLILNSVARK